MQALRAFHLRQTDDALFVAGKAPLQRALCDALTASGFADVSGVEPGITAAMGVAGARIIHGEMGL